MSFFDRVDMGHEGLHPDDRGSADAEQRQSQQPAEEEVLQSHAARRDPVRDDEPDRAERGSGEPERDEALAAFFCVRIRFGRKRRLVRDDDAGGFLARVFCAGVGGLGGSLPGQLALHRLAFVGLRLDDAPAGSSAGHFRLLSVRGAE